MVRSSWCSRGFLNGWGEQTNVLNGLVYQSFLLHELPVLCVMGVGVCVSNFQHQHLTLLTMSQMQLQPHLRCFHASHAVAVAPAVPRDASLNSPASLTACLSDIFTPPAPPSHVCSRMWHRRILAETSTDPERKPPHPWPWKRWLVPWWHIYRLICSSFLCWLQLFHRSTWEAPFGLGK